MSERFIRVAAHLADDIAVRRLAAALFPVRPMWIAVSVTCGLLVTLWGRISEEYPAPPLYLPSEELERLAGWQGASGDFGNAFRKEFGDDGDALWGDRRWGVLRRDVTDRRPDIPMAVKRAVYERDDYRCTRCPSETMLELDHIVPWAQGGEHTVENLRVLCWPCHRDRHREDRE